MNTIIPASDETTTTELLQLAKIMELVGEAADIARIEITQPPPSVGPGQPGTWTRITGFLQRIEGAIVIYERLGGPALPPEAKQFARDGRKLPTRPALIVGEATGVFERLKDFADGLDHAG